MGIEKGTEIYLGTNDHVENKKSLRDTVLESIRQAIISGELRPGQLLKERELAKKVGISTTPIKEALRILSHEGWVETVPRKGTFVSEMVNSSIMELLLLKANLESLAARLAAEKISEEELEALYIHVNVMELLVELRSVEKLKMANARFHLMIHMAAHNPVIFHMISNVVALDVSFRERAYVDIQEVEMGFADHKAIFEAIKQRNPDLAEERMKNHISRSAKRVLDKCKPFL